MVAQQEGRATAMALVMAGLVVCGTGCSGGGAAAEDVGTGADTVGTLRQAAGALERAGSAKATTSMEMATGGTRVTIRGQGVYDFRKQTGRLKVLLPEDPAGADEHRPITELLAPGALFMKNRGAGVPADKWVRVDTAGLSDGNLVAAGPPTRTPRPSCCAARGRPRTWAGPRWPAPRCGTTAGPPICWWPRGVRPPGSGPR